MGAMYPLLDPDIWYRRGRGMGFHFDLPEREVSAALLSDAPEEFAPYFLLIEKSKRQPNGKYKWWHELVDIAALPSYAGSGFWNLVFGSSVLSGDPKALCSRTKTDPRSGLLSTSGLILLQIGLPPRHQGHGTSIGIVSLVENIDTGEVRRHLEYLSIYKALKAGITRRLKSSARRG